MSRLVLSHRRGCAWLLLASWAALFCGCNGSSYPSVRGKVTLGGQPLSGGTVIFFPDGKGTITYGTIGNDGSYTMMTGASSGVSPGRYKIAVKPPSGMAPDGSSPKSPIPEKFQNQESSGLSIEVKDGDSLTHDIPLQ